jgi:hypothetical protein
VWIKPRRQATGHPKVKREPHDERRESVRPNHVWHLDFVHRHINRALTFNLILLDEHHAAGVKVYVDAESSFVRGKLTAHFDDLMCLGVDGFRMDVGKHVPVADLEAIFAGLDGTTVIHDEIIEGEPGEVSPLEYVGTGDLQGRQLTANTGADRIGLHPPRSGRRCDWSAAPGSESLVMHERGVAGERRGSGSAPRPGTVAQDRRDGPADRRVRLEADLTR